jgi:hypothetical protein
MESRQYPRGIFRCNAICAIEGQFDSPIGQGSERRVALSPNFQLRSPTNCQVISKNTERSALRRAVAARTPQLRTAFLGLSKNWEKLAIQL